MPKCHTFSDGNHMFSVDMMHAYVNLNKPKVEMDYVLKYLEPMKYNIWGEHSPLDVIKNPKKYKEDMLLVKKANMSYPIYVSDDIVIDGHHRLLRAYMNNVQKIKLIRFPYELLMKFKIGTTIKSVKDMEIHEYIELYYKTFNKTKKPAKSSKK